MISDRFLWKQLAEDRKARVRELEEAIRQHRDERFPYSSNAERERKHDAASERLYKVLPETEELLVSRDLYDAQFERVAKYRALLKRIAEWDHMQTAGDGAYWLTEIARLFAEDQPAVVIWEEAADG